MKLLNRDNAVSFSEAQKKSNIEDLTGLPAFFGISLRLVAAKKIKVKSLSHSSFRCLQPSPSSRQVVLEFASEKKSVGHSSNLSDKGLKKIRRSSEPPIQCEGEHLELKMATTESKRCRQPTFSSQTTLGPPPYTWCEKTARESLFSSRGHLSQTLCPPFPVKARSMVNGVCKQKHKNRKNHFCNCSGSHHRKGWKTGVNSA